MSSSGEFVISETVRWRPVIWIRVVQPASLALMMEHKASSGHWCGGGLSPHVSLQAHSSCRA